MPVTLNKFPRPACPDALAVNWLSAKLKKFPRESAMWLHSYQSPYPARGPLFYPKPFSSLTPNTRRSHATRMDDHLDPPVRRGCLLVVHCLRREITFPKAQEQENLPADRASR